MCSFPQINVLNEWHGTNCIIIFAKKHKNGHSLDTMSTPGFAESFIGKDSKKRPESGNAVLQLALSEFKSK